MQFQQIQMKIDETVNLKAIIAIHNTVSGPALGGCRCIEYSSTSAAITDAIMLAQSMAYKAALANLPLGGGKMVLLKPKQIKDRTAYFKSVGQFVNSFQGRSLPLSTAEPHQWTWISLQQKPSMLQQPIIVIFW